MLAESYMEESAESGLIRQAHFCTTLQRDFYKLVNCLTKGKKGQAAYTKGN